MKWNVVQNKGEWGLKRARDMKLKLEIELGLLQYFQEDWELESMEYFWNDVDSTKVNLGEDDNLVWSLSIAMVLVLIIIIRLWEKEVTTISHGDLFGVLELQHG